MISTKRQYTSPIDPDDTVFTAEEWLFSEDIQNFFLPTDGHACWAKDGFFCYSSDAWEGLQLDATHVVFFGK